MNINNFLILFLSFVIVLFMNSNVNNECINDDVVKTISEYFNIPYSFSCLITRISFFEGFDPFFISALIYTESSFRINAKSNKGYFGLMQVDKKILKSDENIKYGIDILRDKIKISNGNIIDAIILYKGYKKDYNRGLEQANKVLSYFNNMKNKYNKRGDEI